MNPFRETYPVGSVAVSNPVRLPVMIPERFVDAPLISVFVKLDPVSVIPPVRSTFWMTSDERFTAGPKMVPDRAKYPVGSRVAAAVPPVRPKLRIPVTVAPERSTPLISMLNNDALVRLADVRRVRVRSATPAPDISRFERAVLERLTAGPTMKLLYIMYPVGNTVGGVAVTDALRRLPDTRFVKLAPDRSVPERSVPAMDIPERSMDESADP
jgi:hypothetical protein